MIQFTLFVRKGGGRLQSPEIRPRKSTFKKIFAPSLKKIRNGAPGHVKESPQKILEIIPECFSEVLFRLQSPEIHPRKSTVLKIIFLPSPKKIQNGAPGHVKLSPQKIPDVIPVIYLLETICIS